LDSIRFILLYFASSIVSLSLTPGCTPRCCNPIPWFLECPSDNAPRGRRRREFFIRCARLVLLPQHEEALVRAQTAIGRDRPSDVRTFDFRARPFVPVRRAPAHFTALHRTSHADLTRISRMQPKVSTWRMSSVRTERDCPGS
jgi:hypothetical protein